MKSEWQLIESAGLQTVIDHLKAENADLQKQIARHDKEMKDMAFELGELKNDRAMCLDTIDKLKAENVALRQRILDDNKAYGCELRAWSGTIWDHAKQLQAENNTLRAALIRARLYVCWGDEDKNYQAVIKRVTEDRAFIDAALGKEAQP